MEKYPVSLSIDYSNKSNRLTVLFRLFLAIPILIILMLITYSGYENQPASKEAENAYWIGILFLPTLLMIVFQRKYPKWWFDWNLNLTKFYLRITSYLLLLRDEYPSTDEEQAVHVQINYPDVEKELDQWLPLIKLLLVIPHFIVLSFIMVGVIFCTVFAWFVILFIGEYPKSMFDFVVGFLRWTLRVNAYAILLTTDKYPPFSLSE